MATQKRRLGGRGTNQYSVQPMSARTASDEHDQVREVQDARQMYYVPQTNHRAEDDNLQDAKLNSYLDDRRRALRSGSDPDEVDDSYVTSTYPESYVSALKMDDGDSPIYDDATGKERLSHKGLSECMQEELSGTYDNEDELRDSCDHDAAVVVSHRSPRQSRARYDDMSRTLRHRVEQRSAAFAF